LDKEDRHRPIEARWERNGFSRNPADNRNGGPPVTIEFAKEKFPRDAPSAFRESKEKTLEPRVISPTFLKPTVSESL
jgi:hypothetical protein